MDLQSSLSSLVNSCLISLMTFYNEITSLKVEGRAVEVECLELSEAFDSVCHNILLDKLVKCGLDKWMARWSENWLKLSSENCDQ